MKSIILPISRDMKCLIAHLENPGKIVMYLLYLYTTVTATNYVISAALRGAE